MLLTFVYMLRVLIGGFGMGRMGQVCRVSCPTVLLWSLLLHYHFPLLHLSPFALCPLWLWSEWKFSLGTAIRSQPVAVWTPKGRLSFDIRPAYWPPFTPYHRPLFTPSHIGMDGVSLSFPLEDPFLCPASVCSCCTAWAM